MHKKGKVGKTPGEKGGLKKAKARNIEFTAIIKHPSTI